MGSALNPSTPKEERADMSFSRYTYCHVIKSYMIQEETETYDRGGKTVNRSRSTDGPDVRISGRVVKYFL
jgi:hypothetical protein